MKTVPPATLPPPKHTPESLAVHLTRAVSTCCGQPLSLVLGTQHGPAILGARHKKPPLRGEASCLGPPGESPCNPR